MTIYEILFLSVLKFFEMNNVISSGLAFEVFACVGSPRLVFGFLVFRGLGIEKLGIRMYKYLKLSEIYAIIQRSVCMETN